MKIGIDGSRAFLKENTGTENYSLNLIKSLAKVDKKNDYRIYLRQNSESKFSFRQLRKQFPKNFEFRLIKPNKLWTQVGLALETWRSPVDLLFIPAHTLPILRNYRVKTLVTIHDLGVEFLPDFHKFPQRYYLDFASKYASKNADRLIAVSGQTAKDLVRRYDIKRDNIDIVYEGVDKRVFYKKSGSKVRDIKGKYGIYGDYFLYVGTVQPRKNLMFLIDTFATFVKSKRVKSLVTKYNKDIHTPKLIIAGKTGWDYDEIVTLPKKLGIENSVHFLGYVPQDDLVALYSGACAFLFPSLFEGFGLPILEALSCKCPVIASDIPVHREILNITRGYNRCICVEGLKNKKNNKIWHLTYNNTRGYNFAWCNSAGKVSKNHKNTDANFMNTRGYCRFCRNIFEKNNKNVLPGNGEMLEIKGEKAESGINRKDFEKDLGNGCLYKGSHYCFQGGPSGTGKLKQRDYSLFCGNFTKKCLYCDNFGKNRELEPISLAKVNDTKEWLRFLYQTYTLVYQGYFDHIRDFFDARTWSWETVARQTLMVFNKMKEQG